MEPDTSPNNNNNNKGDTTHQDARAIQTQDTAVILKKIVFILSDKRKVNEKLLIITKNRFYVKSQRTPSKTDFSVNLLRIRSLYCKDAKHISVGVEKLFGTPIGSKSEVVVTGYDFIVESADQEEIIVALLTPLKPLGMWHDRIELTIEQKDRSAKIYRSLSESAALLSTPPNQACDGFNLIYPMLCDLYDVSCHEEVLWDIENAYFSRGRKTLSFSDFSHLPAKDLLPVIAAMEYNQYFLGLSLVDTKLTSEGIEVLQKVLRNNNTLTHLTLKNVGLKYDSVHRLMTRSLSNNKKSALTFIDLSDNPLEDKGIADVANAIERLPNISNVILTRCLMTSKGSLILTNSLMKSSYARSSLVELSIGENPLYQGNSLHGFLKYIATPNSLTKLDLNICGIPLEFLCNALAQSSLHTLEELYFACNIKLPQGHRSHSISSPYYKHFFSSTRALRHIDMSNCRLHSDTIVLILEGLRENVSGVKLVLDLSGNVFTPRLQEIANLIGQITVLQTLRIYNVGVNEHYEEVVTKISSNRNLRHLYLGKNFRKAKWLAGEALQIFAINSELQTLSLSECKLKDAIQFLIRSLKQNHTLKVLDISGNLMGDSGARLLAKVLHMNSTLQVLKYDQNNLSPNGLGYISSALKANHTLRDMSFPIQDLFQIKRDFEKDKLSLTRAEQYLQKIEECLKRNHSQSTHSLELKSQQNKLSVRIMSILHTIEQTSGKLKSILDRTVRSKDTRSDVREANSLLAQLEDCIKLSHALYPETRQQTDATEINSLVDRQLKKLVTSLYHSNVDSSKLMKPEHLDTKFPDLFTHQHYQILKKDLADLAQESEAKLTEDIQFTAREMATSSVLTCNINLCILTLDRIVPTLVHSSELLIARLKSLQNEGANASNQGTVAERITNSICSRPVSYLARTPPMPTRLTDSLNSIEDDTESRLSLSLISPILPDDFTPILKQKPEEAIIPIQQTGCEYTTSKIPDKDSLDFEISLRSETTDIPLDITPATSPSIDSDRVRSALDFFDQSLQMDSDNSTEIDFDSIVNSEIVKLEFLTKTRAPRPKGRRPQPRPRFKLHCEPVSEDIFLEIAHTAVAGIEDKSCQIQIKPCPPSQHDTKDTKVNIQKSLSADSADRDGTGTRPRSGRKENRPLTEPNFLNLEIPIQIKPILMDKEARPAKPVRNASFPARPVPPIRKKPTPSPHEPTITQPQAPKLPSKSCSSAITEKLSGNEAETQDTMDTVVVTAKSVSTPQPRERKRETESPPKESDTAQSHIKEITGPNSAMASLLRNALSKNPSDKISSPPVPPAKPPHMRDAPPLPTKSPMIPPLKPPSLALHLEQGKGTPPERPTSPPKGLIQELPSKPVPPPRIRRETLDKRDKKERESVLV